MRNAGKISQKNGEHTRIDIFLEILAGHYCDITDRKAKKITVTPMPKPEINRIRISEKPLKKDDGGSLIYKSPNGKFYKVFGFIDIDDPLTPGWKEITAVQTTIQGRMSKIFVSPSEIPLLQREISNQISL